jgi:predicted transcriptional regulator
MTSYGYNSDMARQKVTVYLDPDVLRSMRVVAARRGIKDSDLVEQAVREYIGIAAWERMWAETAKLGLTDDEAMALALEAQHAGRRAAE